MNEIFYDYLEGIVNREYYLIFVEEDVVLLFKKGELEEIDLGLIELNLKRVIEEVSLVLIFILSMVRLIES